MNNLIKNIDPRGKFVGIIILPKLFGYYGELYLKMFWMEIYKCKLVNKLKFITYNWVM